MLGNNDCPVRIAIRERPFKKGEHDDYSVVTYHSTNKNVVVVDERAFVFDDVLPPTTSQQYLFTKLVDPLVRKVIEGYNCTALAYGQTSTGKTYTMGLHSETFSGLHAGIIPQTIQKIFELSQSLPNPVEISASFIEIYSEKVYDMLSENPNKQINTKGHKFLGGIKKKISDIEEGYSLLSSGNKNRHIRPTKMNLQSSRSHAIFTLYLLINTNSGLLSSCFHLVDLAGSEGARRTGHQGIALSEGVHINQGLLSIGKVIQALVTRGKVIPYRDSVLSSVLQDSLNPNSYLMLLACISPCRNDLSETLSTLRFAQNAKSLKTNPRVNSVLSEVKGTIITPLKRRSIFKTPIAQTRSNKTQLGSKIKKSIHRYNTFCTPSKITKNKIRRFNHSDFGLTVNETRRKYKVVHKKNLQRFSPNHSSCNNEPIKDCADAVDSGESMLSLNMSTSTAIDVPMPPSSTWYAPIIKNCMTEFVTALENKTQQMKEHYKTVNSTETTKTVENNAHSPWSSLKRELKHFIHNEILTLSSNAGTCLDASTAQQTGKSDALQQGLSSGTTPVFKIPEISNKDKCNQSTAHTEGVNYTFFFGEGNRTVINKIQDEDKSCNLTGNKSLRRSSRLSGFTRANEFQTCLDKSKVRRSTRIEQQHQVKFNSLNKKESNVDVIEKYFGHISRKSNRNIKSQHESAILDLLNSGTVKQLQLLPQIGLKTAYHIVTHRTLNGEFQSFEQVSKLPIWRGSSWQRFKEANVIS